MGAPRQMVSSIFLCMCFAALPGLCQDENLRFLLVNGGSTFFEPVFLGFNKTCGDLNVSCEYVRPGGCDERQIAVREFIASGGSGIIYRPCGEELQDRPIIQEAADAGIPVIEFDNQTPGAARLAYVGTDNEFMGRTIAKLLRQLRPEGGTFSIIAEKAGRLEGFLDEITKDNHRPDRAHWFEVEKNFTLDGLGSEYMRHMELYAKLNPTAMIFMKQTPMKHQNWENFVDANRHKNITLIGVDGSDFQLSYLDRRYVDGLVGQLPYEFGSLALQVLHKYVTTGILEKEVWTTNVVSYNLIPVELPPVDLDENLIGHLKYVGFFFFGVVAMSAISCVCWTWFYRHSIVVKAAQPFFLIMIAGGVLFMSGTLIPLSFDDGGNDLSEQHSVGICMSIPWLASCGFTVTFSALFSKTWRVNQIFHSKHRHTKLQVREKDVLLPFFVLFALNIIVLVCWTVFDPLTYVRLEYEGTDFWNRVIATYGSCHSQRVAAYLIPLALINCSVLMFAGWHAYKARDIKVEFAESKFIGLTMFSLGQGFFTGIPIVAVVRETPQAFYLVLAMLIFLLSMVTLLLIFLPKYLMLRKYESLSQSEQQKMIADSVLQSSLGNKRSSALYPSRAFEHSGSMDRIDEGKPSATTKAAKKDRNEEKCSECIKAQAELRLNEERENNLQSNDDDKHDGTYTGSGTNDLSPAALATNERGPSSSVRIQVISNRDHSGSGRLCTEERPSERPAEASNS